MKSLFNNKTQEEIAVRLKNLCESSEAQWGRMRVDQMLKHCQGPLEVAMGSKQLDPNIGFMKKLLFRAFKPTMYNDKLWQQNIPTAKDYLIVDTYNFEEERHKLETVISQFSQLEDKTDWPKHPYFGHFTTEQWGQLQYKHLDHHFRQFGV